MRPANFFARYLVSSFAYLDLVLQDTPFNDQAVESHLRRQVQQVDNLSDAEEQKLDRMQVRFDRVRYFLDYLNQEEEREAQEFDLNKRASNWAGPIIPSIRKQIDDEIDWIERRLRENRERFAEDIKMFTGEEPDALDDHDTNDDDSSPEGE